MAKVSAAVAWCYTCLWTLLLDDADCFCLQAGSVLIPFFQQFTGINTIMFYATQLFAVLGQGQKAALLSTAIVGAVNVGSTIIAIVLVDRSVYFCLPASHCHFVTNAACAGCCFCRTWLLAVCMHVRYEVACASEAAAHTACRMCLHMLSSPACQDTCVRR